MVVGTGIDEGPVLRRAGIEQADCFASVTNGDNRNIMAAQVAKVVFNVPRVITRIYDPIREQTYREFGLETICLNEHRRLHDQHLFHHWREPRVFRAAPGAGGGPEMSAEMNGAGRPYLVIIGGGKVGFYLARHLIERDYEVTLVEKDPGRAEWIEHQMGTVSVMVGDGDEMAFLATTGIERAGVVIACTGDDEDNLVACQLAKGKFRVPRTIARVNNPVNVHVFTALGIDVPVSATELLMGLIEAEISASDAVRGVAVKASGANLVDIKLADMSRLASGRPAERREAARGGPGGVHRARRRTGAGPA